MAVTRANLDTELTDLLASTSNIKTSTASRQRALNRALDIMQLKGAWIFTNRRQTFDYIPSVEDYNLRTYIGVTDFKELYQIWKKDIPIVDARRIQGRRHIKRHNKTVTRTGADEIGQKMKDQDHYLSLNLREGNTAVIDRLSSLTADGTWSASDDAVSLAADTNEFERGSGSLKFNIDVSNSANNYATIANTTKTAQNFTQKEDRSYLTLDFYSPTTSITSIELRWGSDSSNYWTKTETAPIDTASFQTGWNLMAFSWQDATQTGSPDVENVDTYLIRINYAASLTDQTNARISYLTIDDRTQLDMEYFSQHMVKDTNGTYQSRFEASTDELLAPDEVKAAVVELAYFEVLRKARTTNQTDKNEAKQNAQELLDDAFFEYGYTSKRKGVKSINAGI
jgi:hypothetical protein